MSTVIADQLKLIYPDCHIDYLVAANATDIVLEHPSIDGIIAVNKEEFDGLGSAISLSRKLKKKKYDLLIDAYSKNNSALLSLLSNIPKRIGYKKWFSKIAYTEQVNEKPEPGLFTTGEAVGTRLMLTEPLTGTVEWNLKPKIQLTKLEKAEGLQWIHKHGLNLSKKLTMVSVLGSSENKTLPFQSMAQILDLHIKNTSSQMLFNYIPSQKSEVERIYSLCKKETQSSIFLDAFAPSIRGFLKILSHCDACIGNEGGAINMAKALNVPTFSIYSPWIKKMAWNTGEDGKNHISVHLADFEPELYKGHRPVDFKHRTEELYSRFSVEDIYSELHKFEGFHFK